MLLEMGAKSGRKPGPAGFPFDRTVDGLTVELNDYRRLKNVYGTVYVREQPNARAEADHRVKLRVHVKEKPVVITKADKTRASTHSVLYLTYVARDTGNGRFDAYFSDIQIDSTITIFEDRKFERLEEFESYYREFQALVATTRSRRAALKQFTNRYIEETRNSRGSIVEVATKFWGLRAKAMQHEVTHARHAQSQTVNQIDNLLGEWKKASRRRKKTRSAGQKAFKELDAVFRYWNTDVGNEFHRKIVEHDCLFMIKMYEQNILALPSAADAMSPAIVDELTLLAMHELNQPPPWT